MQKLILDTIEEYGKWIDIALRKAIVEGYQAGKKQIETPYDYTLDTDKIGKKHFDVIMGFIKQAFESGQKSREKEIVEEIEITGVPIQ